MEELLAALTCEGGGPETIGAPTQLGQWPTKDEPRPHQIGRAIGDYSLNGR